MAKIEVELLAWTPILNGRGGYPRDRRGNAYMSGKLLIQAFQSSVIFYYTGKDSFVENRIRRYLNGGFRVVKAVPDILNIVIDRHDVLTGLWVPDRIYIPEDNLKEVTAVVYDLERDEIVESVETEAFVGTLKLDLNLREPSRLMPAFHSFSEALARMERSMAEEVESIRKFYDDYINELKRQEMPLRLGWWTDNRYGAAMLFFWKVKEIREMLLKRHGVDILPRRIVYVADEGQPAGWAELKLAPGENEEEQS